MLKSPPERMPRVLVVGGYGAFGQRVAERLVRGGDTQVVIAGRSEARAFAAAARLGREAKCAVTHEQVDAERPDVKLLGRIAADVIVNASGPFQMQDYALARAAIAVGSHYLDLADARAYVTGIGVLDAEAKAADVLVASGASSVPALAAAIVDHHRPDFLRLDSIEHCITPGNGYDPGVATTASILAGLGKPIPMLIDGTWQTMYGWLGVRRVELPGLGLRWMAHCDVPDLELFPRAYRGVRTVRFCAGLEVSMFQLSLWLMAGAVRRGMLTRPERLAGPLMAAKRCLRFLGSDTGGMLVRLEGQGRDARPLVRETMLVARNNEGPFVPALASVVLARKLARGTIEARGAVPCIGLLRLHEFAAEAADLAIELTHRTVAADEPVVAAGPAAVSAARHR